MAWCSVKAQGQLYHYPRAEQRCGAESRTLKNILPAVASPTFNHDDSLSFLTSRIEICLIRSSRRLALLWLQNCAIQPENDGFFISDRLHVRIS